MRPAKKRDRELPSTSNGISSLAANNAGIAPATLNGEQQMRNLGQRQEQELFLQAFEKPTQIYRFLRNRHGTNAIFLNRTLGYMKHRMSRSHKNRATFKVDSLLETVQHKLEAGTSNFVNVAYQGLFDKLYQPEQWFSSDASVSIEATLSKITKSKRKDRTSDYQEIMHHRSSVTFNPNENACEYSVISIPVQIMQPLGDQHTSYKLVFVIRIPVKPNIENGNADLSSSSSSEAAPTKENNTRAYGCELIIFEKSAGFIRTAGYEAALYELPYNGFKTFSPKKRTWEALPDTYNPVSSKINKFDKHPTLKFQVAWSAIEVPNKIMTADMSKYGFIELKTNASNADEAALALENTQINHNNNCIKYQNNTRVRAEQMRIVYNFLYSNNTHQQTEYTDELKCPWCGLDCARLSSLLKHLKLCHARFSFTWQIANNGASIDVTINDAYDGSYAGSPYDLAGSSGCSFARTCGPVRRTSMTDILVIRMRRQKQSFDELVMDEDELSNPRPYITGHNRLYHHTATCLPVHPKELDFDSENEIDPEWLRHKTIQMIDEFSDVNEGEKEIMKMWNLHVMKYGFVGDCQMPLACDMFVEAHGEQIFRKNLYRNYVLHLCNLFDYSVISAETVKKNLQKLKGILSKFPEGQEIMSAQRKLQLKHWLEVGRHKEEELKNKSPAKTPPKLSPIPNIEFESGSESSSDSSFEEFRPRPTVIAIKRAEPNMPHSVLREKLARLQSITLNVAKKTATQKELKAAKRNKRTNAANLSSSEDDNAEPSTSSNARRREQNGVGRAHMNATNGRKRNAAAMLNQNLLSKRMRFSQNNGNAIRKRLSFDEEETSTAPTADGVAAKLPKRVIKRRASESSKSSTSSGASSSTVNQKKVMLKTDHLLRSRHSLPRSLSKSKARKRST